MKKLLVLSVLLGLLALPMAFAEVTIGGDVQFFANADQDDTNFASHAGKLRVRINADVDENNTVKLEFRDDGMTWMGTYPVVLVDDNAVSGGDTSTFDMPEDLTWKFAYLQTDISGALGIDAVGITARFGFFEEWHALWNAATSWHRSRDLNVEWGTGNGNIAGAALDFDLGMVALKSYFEFDGPDFVNAYKFAASSEETLLDGLSFIVGYVGYVDGPKGFIHGDAGYSTDIGDISLTIPVSFVYNMEAESFGYGTGVKFGYGMFGVNVGLGTGEGGDVSVDFLNYLDAEVMVSPIDNATIYAKAYNHISDPSGFQALDIGAKYAFGAMTFYLGYVYADDDAFTTVVCEDDSGSRHGVTGSAFYLGANLGF